VARDPLSGPIRWHRHRSLELRAAALADRRARERGRALHAPTTRSCCAAVTRTFGALARGRRCVAERSAAARGTRSSARTAPARRRCSTRSPATSRRRAGRSTSSARTSPSLPPYERIRKGLRRTYQSSLLFRDLSVRDNLFLAVRGVANGRFSFLRRGRGHASTLATADLLERPL
jgi:branched-chain amino acid transport system ATP-binding protein